MSEEKYHWTTEYDGFNDVLDEEGAEVSSAPESGTIVLDPVAQNAAERNTAVLNPDSPESEPPETELQESEEQDTEAQVMESEAAESQGTQESQEPPILELAPEDAEELAARIEARRRQRRRKRIRRKRFTVFCIILVFVFLFTMCGREIFRLKAENYALQKQQEELIAERDRLTEELKKVSDKEYIKNQARKQLRLLDPGEIMFIFEGDEEETEPEKTD